MERSAVLSRRSTPEEVGGFDLSPVQSEEAAHVLAVDDSIVDRKVIERLLKIFSCKVTAVDSGRRALQLLGLDEERTSAGFDVKGLKVDLIITDYCMPGMNGYELLKKIKESSTFRQTPVVIMSSEHILARIERCLEEGAEDFIVKPVKLSDVKRLRDYMTREDRDGNESRGINKRKLGDACDVSPSLSSPSPPPPPPPPPPSNSSSPPSISSSPPSISSSPPSNSSSPPSISSSPPSISSSPSSRSAPSSPTSLDSPTRRLKASSCD